MKILLVLSGYYPAWGGAENQAHKQAIELVRRGHTVEVVTWRYDPRWPRTEVIDGVTIYRVNRAHGALLAVLAMARALIRAAWRADAIAAHHMLRTAYLAG